MKITLAKLVVCLIAFGLSVQTVDAQAKKRPTTKAAAKKTTTKKAVVTQNNANLMATPKDTVAPVVVKKDPFQLDTIRLSLRNDASIQRNLIKERNPLEYENIREDDAWFRERVWREIDIREKMNLGFRYTANEDNGNQRFINILLTSIKLGNITAFDANLDDRFTTPLTMQQVGALLSGKCDSSQVPDYAKDPTGSRGFMKDTLICNEFNPDAIVKFRLKEEWVFDKESSRMYARIIGIAPVKTFIDSKTNMFLGEAPLFWVYYPDLRPTLAKYEVYNGKNFGARMSWEELFESRFFASYIIKSTFDNPYDLPIKSYVKDEILRLLESDNIKDKIFNFEQDLWAY
jgi:gliding motility associated protien GldN